MKKGFIFAGIFCAAVALSSCDFSFGHGVSSTFSSISTSGETTDKYGRISTPYDYEDVNRNGGDGLYQATLSSRGTRSILVLPIIQTDFDLSSSEQQTLLSRLESCFFGDSSDTSWESVSSFYEKSSYGQLHLVGEVMPWYDSGYTSTQIARMNSSPGTAEGAVRVMEEAINYWVNVGRLDTNDFDQDDDGFIDAVWVIYSGHNYTHDPYNITDNNWAYTYWDFNTPNTYNPEPMSFSWASWDFMDEGYGDTGIDAHTYIHETGHLLGLPDYYDASGEYPPVSPAGAVDMMDNNIIDHNAWTKFALGWISPQMANNTSKTIKLGSFAETGDALVIPMPNGYNGTAFDEFLMVEYYTPTNLNEKDAEETYSNDVPAMNQSGIRIWHVDSRIVQAEVTMSIFGRYSYSFSYIDDLLELGDSYVEEGSTIITNQMLAFSNSQGYNVQQMYSDFDWADSFDTSSFRQLTFISSRNIPFGERYNMQTEEDLFYAGDSFDPSIHYAQFPMGNDGYTNDGSSISDLPVIRVDSLGEEAVITILYQ